MCVHGACPLPSGAAGVRREGPEKAASQTCEPGWGGLPNTQWAFRKQWMDGWTGGQADGWMEGRMDGRRVGRRLSTRTCIGRSLLGGAVPGHACGERHPAGISRYTHLPQTRSPG